MIPILYKSAEVDFTTNGLGLLNDIYSVDIQEQRNGLLTLTASYPTNAKHYKEIETGRIIYAKPNPLDGAQAFRIVKTELDISGYNLNIEADHITYDLTHNLVKEVHLQGDGQNAMTHLQNATVTPHLFRFVSDLQHLGDSRLQYVNPMEAIAGTEGSILQIWGGELHRDNRTVSMLSRRGRDNFTTFRLGKNINGLKYTVDMSNVTTRIVPTVTKSDATDNDKAYFVVGDTVDSKNLNKYPNVYIQHVDMGEKVTINEGETDEQIKAKIDKQAKNWFTQSANTGIDLPQVTVEIDVTSLQDSADYQEKFRNLESVGLTDTVSVYVPEFNVNVTAIVNELHYDPVAERVTSLVVGTSKKSFADNNSNALAELQNSITQIRQDATTAIVSSNGKNTNYYGTEEPAHPVEGDLWFKSVGDETYLMIFKDGRWQEWVSTKTQEEIAKKVDDAIQKAKEYTDELNEKQAEEVQKFQSEANAALSSAAAERTVFSSNAASMASSASAHADTVANSASAYAKAEAASALSSANSALTTAKSDLTTAIGQEIEDRNKAVSVVNSQAQDYADQAKSDAIAAANTADGQVRKDFKVTTDALSSTISQNKQDSEGKISTAQTTATQALDGLKTKVSQSDYDKKTGDLSTAVNTVTQTATETKNELAKVSETVGSQSAQINTISNTVDGTKQTISDIKTEQGKQSGSIATLQSRADGFDATVTKVDNLSVGGTNLIRSSEFDRYWSKPSQATTVDGYNGHKAIHVDVTGWTDNSFIDVQQPIYNADVQLIKSGEWYTISFYAKGKGTIRTHIYPSVIDTSAGSYTDGVFSSGYVPSDGYRDWALTDEYVRHSWSFKARTTLSPTTNEGKMLFRSVAGNSTYVSLPKLEQGNVATDWSPAPEDLSSATAKAQLTADNANLDLSKYKTDADGRISKAQADITATANEVKTKVSQSDFDKTTGDLSTKYGQIKATADAVTTDVAKYKDSNDKKVSANTASISTMSDQISSKVSKTDFDKTTGDLNGKFTQQEQTVDSISQTVTELQAKANSHGQVNQLMNTEFSPDLQGWGISNPNNIATVFTSNGYQGSVGLRVNAYSYNNDDDQTYYKVEQTLDIPDFISFLSLKVRGYIYEISDNGYAYVNANVAALDSTGKNIGAIVPGAQLFDKNKTQTWQESSPKFVGMSVPEGTKKILISIYVRGRASINISQPMVVFDSTIGDYVPGNYNNNNRVAALELGVDHITGLVNDPKNGLSATATLAANGMTVATQAQNDATTAINTAKGTQTTVSSVQKDVKDVQSKQTQTANQLTTEIKDRKSGDESVVTQMTGLIDSRVKNVKSGYETAISQSADTIMASVSMPNKLVNTEFEPDLEGWTINNPLSGTGNPAKIYTSNGYGSSNGLRINAYSYNADDIDAYYQIQQRVKVPDNISVASLHIMGFIYAISSNGYAYVNAKVAALDRNGKNIGTIVPGRELFNKNKTQTWQESSSTFINMAIPKGTDSLQISIYARGQTSVNISQPMLVFNSTVGNYQVGSYNNMGTSTVLELFKDNWALGIADNAGRLISGINGDTSGTVIQGKKLVINSDTTITGKAFINGAVIKNGSIGTAQIGKAAVGSAQIINVDVSKISGNIANFVTGNINRLNAHVLYGDTGHLGTTDTGRIINKQDNHLQLASKGMYNSANDRAQVELLSHTNDIDANMRGSFNYYSDVRKGHGLGIRLAQNQILAIDEDKGSKMLYLSPYQGGEVRVVSRDKKAYYPMRASSFNAMSSRSAKSNIKPFEDCALDIVKNTKVRTYVKSGKQEIGVISDEADPRMLTDDDNAVSLYDYTSILYKAVQELTEKVEELQNERPNDY